MGVDQTGQDELAGRVDDCVFRCFRAQRIAGGTDVADSVPFDGDKRIRVRRTAGPVDQGAVFDEKSLLPSVHDTFQVPDGSQPIRADGGGLSPRAIAFL